MKMFKYFILAFITFISIQSVHAQSGKENILNTTKTQAIKVYGVCGMCKARIEKAASTVDGIKSAVWDEDTKNLTLKYSQFKKDAVNNVQIKIAAVGHDTENYSATDEAYQKLPDCCKYQRKQ